MIVTMGPTGNLIKGDVLDNNVKGVERALQGYDSQLYVKWNPAKLRGWGCWEIRRRPDLKSVTDISPLPDGSATIVRLDYNEMDLINHVLDVGYLDYRVLIKIREMDMWARLDKEGKTKEQFTDSIEYEEYKWREKWFSKKDEENRYSAKHHKRFAQDMKDLVLSGVNPHLLLQFDHWKNKGSN